MSLAVVLAIFFARGEGGGEVKGRNKIFYLKHTIRKD